MNPPNADRGPRSTSWLRLLAFALWALCVAGAAQATESKLTKDDEACLKCHDSKVATEKLAPKKLEDGTLLSLDISTHNFIESQHNGTACEDCHGNIDKATHGKKTVPLASRRKLTESMQETCRDCHKKRFKEFEDSVHAALIKQGSDKAPLCSTCHEPHTQPSVKIVQPIEKTPCAQCHKDIFKAYSKDVHGLERVAKGKQAPICGDCHKTHDIKAASFGDSQKDACLKCHDKAEAQHKDWLPNSKLHFSAVTCAACHAPAAKRRVNLRLFDTTTDKQAVDKLGVPNFISHVATADAQNRGLNESDVTKLLEGYQRDLGGKNVSVLQGRLEVATGVDAHQLAEKEKALKDCAACHKKGAEPFQAVVISVAGPDGRAMRHSVQKDVLSSEMALESVRGFYALGATRMKALDYLLLLVVLGAAAVPLGHAAMMAFFRRSRATSKHNHH